MANNRMAALTAVLLALLCSCTNQPGGQRDTGAGNPSGAPAAVASAESNEGFADPAPWNMTGENTVGPGLYDRGHDSLSQSYRLLEQWMAAWRSGESCQIYICDTSSTMPRTWRITCDGSEEYTIEMEGATDIYRSRWVTEGAIYVSFGDDVPGLKDLSRPPPTVWKGWEEAVALEKDTEEWQLQGSITASQAEAIAAASIHLVEPGGMGIGCTVRERLRYLGQCFYSVELENGGTILVSADGNTLLYGDAVGGAGFHLIQDTSSWTVFPGDERTDIDARWRARRDQVPYVPSSLESYQKERRISRNPEAPDYVGALVWESGSDRWPSTYIGAWQAGERSGADLDRYIFEGDGTFSYGRDVLMGADRLRYSTGEWWYEDGTIYLSASSVLMHEGGEVVLEPTSGYMANYIKGGEYVRYDLAEEERVVEAYPVKDLGEEHPDYPLGRHSIQLGDDILWVTGSNNFWCEHLTRFRDDVDFEAY